MEGNKFKNKKAERKKQSKLEDLIKKEKIKLKPLELIFLEDLINSLLKKPAVKTDKVKGEVIPKFVEIRKISDEHEEIMISYSIFSESRKENKYNPGYSVSIEYEQKEANEKLSIKVKFDDYSVNEKTLNELDKPPNNKKDYFFEIIREKESKSKTKDNYSLSIVYKDNYEKERLSIQYKSTIGAYLNKRQEALHDFSDRVPGKHLHILPENIMGSVLGFTYLGENFMVRRADLTGRIAEMVDIHESIHTPNEYETRLLTDAIMSKERTRYIK